MSKLQSSASVRVEVVSVEEARAIFAKLGHRPANGEMFHGFVEAVCREADGEEAWRIAQPNVVTDYGRRTFMSTGLGTVPSLYLLTSPSPEQPAVTRYSLPDETQGSQVSTAITPTYNSSTLTKTWFYTFAAPAGQRTIATIALGSNNGAAYRVGALVAYTLLSPAKQQTTTQTLEVSYRILFTPIY